MMGSMFRSGTNLNNSDGVAKQILRWLFIICSLVCGAYWRRIYPHRQWSGMLMKATESTPTMTEAIVLPFSESSSALSSDLIAE